MTEQELRSLVREAIARETGYAPGPVPAAARPMFHLHASHGLFPLPAGADTDGPCIIEPAVMCNHCGYCKSYGH
jgi:hypothetical protein